MKKLPPTAKELYSAANDVFEQFMAPELGLCIGLAAALRALVKLKSQEVKVGHEHEYEGTYYSSDDVVLVDDILSLANELDPPYESDD